MNTFNVAVWLKAQEGSVIFKEGSQKDTMKKNRKYVSMGEKSRVTLVVGSDLFFSCTLRKGKRLHPL